ncbi:hypothetical protein [Agromyces arachidis]|uniref:hypothetical protein n=1 Tax=Agromyces arachidis TaxID=766966 RepID=UPI004056F305
MAGRGTRLAAGVSVGIGVVSSLSGCVLLEAQGGPYSLGWDGEHLLIGICQAMEIDRVRLFESRSPGRDDGFVWDARGHIEADAGDVLTVRGSNAGLSDRLASDGVRPLLGVKFDLLVNDRPDADKVAVFVIPSEGLAPGSWLTSRGNEVHDEPCD